MKAEHINPFIESVIETFGRMLECRVTHGKPVATPNADNRDDLIAVIGLSGTAQGTVALKFPEETALSVVGKMVGMTFDEVDSSIIDGIGELVNIIAGNAKAKFEGHRITICLPTVVRGSIFRLNAPAAARMTVPFSGDLGQFDLLISFRPVAIQIEEAVNESSYC
jgi:chemotaxis protein CheX